jgi:hypothetical protein
MRRYCSRQCAATGRARDPEHLEHLRRIAPTGRAGWTEESRASYLEKMSGASNPAWKGGVTILRKKGNYGPVRYVRCPDGFVSMARKDGYVMEHRLVVAMVIGRPLRRREVVHHRNRDPLDNDRSNLALFANNRDHKLYEHHGTPLPIWCGWSEPTTAA